MSSETGGGGGGEGGGVKGGERKGAGCGVYVPRNGAYI